MRKSLKNSGLRHNVHATSLKPILSHREYRQRLHEVGLTVDQATGFCWFPLPRGSNSTLIPMLAKVERSVGLSRWPRYSPWIAVVATKAGNAFPSAIGAVA